MAFLSIPLTSTTATAGPMSLDKNSFETQLGHFTTFRQFHRKRIDCKVLQRKT